MHRRAVRCPRSLPQTRKTPCGHDKTSRAEACAGTGPESVDGSLQSAKARGRKDERGFRKPEKEPAAARNLIPFPVSPAGKAGAGGFPPRRLRRLPPQEGSAPLCIPLRPTQGRGEESSRHLGTFYFAGIRNFLLCVDSRLADEQGASR